MFNEQRIENAKKHFPKKSKEEFQEYLKFLHRGGKAKPHKGKGSYSRKNQKIDFE